MTISVIELRCCALHLNTFSAAFQSDLERFIESGDLLIRSMKDDAPNVVINLDDFSVLKDAHRDAYDIFNELKGTYQYVFISQDFYQEESSYD